MRNHIAPYVATFRVSVSENKYRLLSSACEVAPNGWVGIVDAHVGTTFRLKEAMREHIFSAIVSVKIVLSEGQVQRCTALRLGDVDISMLESANKAGVAQYGDEARELHDEMVRYLYESLLFGLKLLPPYLYCLGQRLKGVLWRSEHSVPAILGRSYAQLT